MVKLLNYKTGDDGYLRPIIPGSSLIFILLDGFIIDWIYFFYELLLILQLRGRKFYKKERTFSETKKKLLSNILESHKNKKPILGKGFDTNREKIIEYRGPEGIVFIAKRFIL